MATVTASVRINGAAANVEELERIEDGLVATLRVLGLDGNIRVEVVETAATRLGRPGTVRTRTDRFVEAGV